MRLVMPDMPNGAEQYDLVIVICGRYAPPKDEAAVECYVAAHDGEIVHDLVQELFDAGLVVYNAVNLGQDELGCPVSPRSAVAARFVWADKLWCQMKNQSQRPDSGGAR